MNSDKNLGRKRLGRIAITGSTHPPKRPCHIVQRNDGIKKTSVVSASHQSFSADLSFSGSFTNDCENDVDLMSALDQMETDFVKKSESKVDASKDVLDGSGRLLRDRSKENLAQTCQDVPHKAQNIHNMHEKGAGNLSTPHRISGGKNSSENMYARENLDSFLDLSFTSPMEVNTPQVFKKKPNSNSRKSSTPRLGTTLTVISNKCSKDSLKPSTSSPMVTPRRSTRKKIKRNSDAETAKNDAADINNSDFFKSLVEDISIDDINVIHDDKNKTHEKVQEKTKSESMHTDKETNKTKVANNTAQGDVLPADMMGTKDNSNEIQPEDLPLIPSRLTGTNDNSFTGSKRLLAIKPNLEKDQLALSSWDLPETVLKQYKSRGITHMFQWQAECLLLGNVLNGGNLVYSAPTSAGKTMVAELLVLKRVIETRKKAIIILPFVSVTREKMFYLQELYQDAGIRVSGFMGHYAPAGGFSSVDVAVCTIEKGNSLINRMLEDNKLDQLGIIVVDEMHLIGDRHRGYLLELLLTKIVYMSKKANLQASSEPTADIQIVGMSATLPNLDLLAGWLNADLYCTDFRPVPLSECVKIGTALYDSSLQLVRDIDVTYAVKGDEDHVVPLCIETIRGGHSILIFCPTKNWCEKLSETVAREFYNLLKNRTAVVEDQSAGVTMASNMLVLPLDQSALKDTVEQLRRTPVGIDSMLGKTVPYGVAYHHAGLTFDERDIVEGAFRQGILKVLVATSTLSSGVNLPARRVLIRTPVFHGQLIDFLTYKQMIGRAGRKGVDTAGESILLCKPNERTKAEKLVKGALPPVHSTLIRDKDEPLSSSLKRAILEVVVSGVATTPEEVTAYASCTLLAASVTKDQTDTADLIQQCVQFLQENEFVCKQTIPAPQGGSTERYVPTQLGAAVLSSSISPDEGLVVFSELLRARQCFVLENELHIIYQVTPIYAQLDSIDWYQYFGIWESLSTGMRKVAELVGVQEAFLAKAVRGRILTKTSAQLKLLAIHKRFYTALVLHDLVQETPLNVVTKKYNCNKGQLQSLQQSAATFAGMVTVFCARLGWSNLELILSQFQNRLTFGVQRELCDLVRISVVNGQRARVMYNGGYQTVASLAGAHPADIEALLKNSAPFQSNKKQESESEWEVAERKKMRCIFLTGRKGVTEYEAAVAIINEAKSIIQEELGGIGVQWDSAGKVQEPPLKSPVLLSPLAANPKSKRRRLSSSKKKTPDNLNASARATSRSPVSAVVSPPPAELITKSASNDVHVAPTEPKCLKYSHQVNITQTVSSKLQMGASISQTKALMSQTGTSLSPTGTSIPQTGTSKDLKMDKPASINMKASSNENSSVIKSSDFGQPNSDAVKVPYQQITVNTTSACQSVFSKSTTIPQKATRSKQTYVPVNCDEIESAKNKMCAGPNDVSKDKKVLDREDRHKKVGDDYLIIEGHVKTVKSAKSVKTGIVNSTHSKQTDIASEPEGHKKSELTDYKEGLPHATSVITSMKEDFGIPNVNEDTEHTSDNVSGNGKKDFQKKVQFSSEPDIEINTPNIEKQKMNKSLHKNLSSKHSSHFGVVSSKRSANLDIESAKSGMNVFPRQTDNVNAIVVTSIESDNEEVGDGGHQSSEVENEKETVFKKTTMDKDLHINHASIKCTADTDEFGESFFIDTQGLQTLENMCGSDLTGNNENVTKESDHVRTKQCISSQAQLPGEECSNDNNDNNDNVMLSESQVNSMFLQDTFEDLSKGSLENKEELVGNITNVTDTSNSFLDMNIINDSNEDMFSNSADLIAASNYEHVGIGGSIVEDTQDHNNSYDDLHIPYQSGQEKCFENADAVSCHGNDHVENAINHLGDFSEKSDKLKEKNHGFEHNVKVLGKFSTPKLESVTVQKSHVELHKELADALEMGMSFSSSFDVPTQNVVVKGQGGMCEEVVTFGDNFGDSLSVSMMDKVFEQSMRGTKCSDTDKGKDSVTAGNSKYDKHGSIDRNIVEGESDLKKQNCDKNVNSCSQYKIYDKNMKSVNTEKMNSDKSPIICDNVKFVTPTRAPVSRSMVAKRVNAQASKEGTVSTTAGLQNKIRETINEAQVCTTSPDLNTSNGSDCVPPTPPDDSSVLSAVSVRGSGTPVRRSLPGASYMASFSPRLQRSIDKPSSKKVEKPLSSAKKIKFDANSAECDKNHDNADDIGMPSDVKTRNDTRNKCSAASEKLNKGSSSNNEIGSNNDKLKNKKLVTRDKCSPVSDRMTNGVSSNYAIDSCSKKDELTNNKLNTRTKSGAMSVGKEIEVSGNNGSTASDNDIIRKLVLGGGNNNKESAEAKVANGHTNNGSVVVKDADDDDKIRKQVLNGVYQESDDVEPDEDNEKADILSPSFIDPEDSGLPLTQSSFSIIDICGDRRLFKTFILEWRTKPRYALSLACEKISPASQGPGIGANFKSGQTPSKVGSMDGFGIPVDSLGVKIVGVAVSWENRDAYYISFTHEQPLGDPDDSLAPPPSDTNISIAIRIKAVKSVLQQKACKDETVVMTMFDVKAHYRGFVEGFGFAPMGVFEDPKIACWMLDPGSKEKNLHRQVTNLLPTEVHMLHGIGGGIGVSSLGMSPQNPGSGRYRACTEAVLVHHLGEYFKACLDKEEIYSTFRDVEMPSAVSLCRMELNGFGFSVEESESQKSIMISKLSALEEQAYRLAGHPFSLSASEDVGQIMFIELQLPPNGDPNATPIQKSLAPKRGTAIRKGRGRTQFSTSKDVLEKLVKLHPLPGIILEWRRITNALTKTVYPLQKEKVQCDWLSMYRIHGDCQLHTATGRVSMTEPNLQNVPKDFEIVLPDLIGESPPANTVQQQRTGRRSSARLQQMIGPHQVAKVTADNTGSKVCLSMRNVFVPFKGGVMLAADYSQLELRMISYLSKDEKLMGILNKDGDVFKLITAQWKNISPDSVTPEQRAQAKQVCYGMIYGIGAKTLAEQLEVDENDAAVFIETFKAKYPGMRRYLRQTPDVCRSQGYVQTMLGRKRYLPSITSTNPHARAQAERQAINTTVQGSAADLVKMAMINIDEKLGEIFPHVQYTHRHKRSAKNFSRNQTPPDGAYLVLQLHDELIYEVTETHVQTVAQIVKHCMETTMELPVKMPVKIKVGPSWGKLADYEL